MTMNSIDDHIVATQLFHNEASYIESAPEDSIFP